MDPRDFFDAPALKVVDDPAAPLRKPPTQRATRRAS